MHNGDHNRENQKYHRPTEENVVPYLLPTNFEVHRVLLQADLKYKIKWQQQKYHNAKSAALCVVSCCYASHLGGRWSRKLLHEALQHGDSYHTRTMRIRKWTGHRTVGIEDLVSSLFIGDKKYTVRLLEVSKGRVMGLGDQRNKQFISAVKSAFASGSSHIVCIGSWCWAVWPADDEEYSACPSAYLFSPRGRGQDARFAGPCLVRYSTIGDLVTDLLENFLDLQKKALKYQLASFSILDAKQVKRSPDNNMQARYIKQHCETKDHGPSGIVKKNQGISEDMTEDPMNFRSPDAMAGFSKQSRYRSILRKGALYDNCTSEKLVCLREPSFEEFHSFEDHPHYTESGGPGTMVLYANKQHSNEKCNINHGLTSCLVVLKKLTEKKAILWSPTNMDECMDISCQLYQEYLSSPPVPLRLTLRQLQLSPSCLPWLGSWSARTIWWGGSRLLATILDDLLDNTSRPAILQIPGELEVALWKTAEKYYLFHPGVYNKDNKLEDVENGEYAKASLSCFSTTSDLAETFKEMVKADICTKDYCLSSVEFQDRPIDDRSAVEIWKVCDLIQNKRDDQDEWCTRGESAAIAISCIAYQTINPPDGWEGEDLQKIVRKGVELFEKSIEQMKRRAQFDDESESARETNGMLQIENGDAQLASADDDDSRYENDTANQDGEAVRGMSKEENSGPINDEVMTGEIVEFNEDEKNNLEFSFSNLIKDFEVAEYHYVKVKIIEDLIQGVLTPSDFSKFDSHNLHQALEEFFKDNCHGVLKIRAKHIAVWKTTDNHYFCFDVCSNHRQNDSSTRFCVSKFSNLRNMCMTVEGDLPPSSDDSFTLSSVTTTLYKLNKNNGMFDLTLQGGFAWLQQATSAFLQVAGASRLGADTSLPAAVVFCCATALVEPSRMTSHHVDAVMESATHLRSELQQDFGSIDWKLMEKLKQQRQVKFGVHSTSFTIGRRRLYRPLVGEIRFSEAATDFLTVLNEEFSHSRGHPLILVAGSLFLAVWRCFDGGCAALFSPAGSLPLKGRGKAKQDKKKGKKAKKAKKPKKPKKPKKKNKKGKKGKKGKAKDDQENKKAPVKKVDPDKDREGSLVLFRDMASLINGLGKIVPAGILRHPVFIYPVHVSAVMPTKHQLSQEGMIDLSLGKNFKLLGPGEWAMKGQGLQRKCISECSANLADEDFAVAVIGVAMDVVENCRGWEPCLLDSMLGYGQQLHQLSQDEGVIKDKQHGLSTTFQVADHMVSTFLEEEVIVGDITADGTDDQVMALEDGLEHFFGELGWFKGILSSRHYTVGIWIMDSEEYSTYKRTNVASQEAIDPSMHEETQETREMDDSDADIPSEEDLEYLNAVHESFDKMVQSYARDKYLSEPKKEKASKKGKKGKNDKNAKEAKNETVKAVEVKRPKAMLKERNDDSASDKQVKESEVGKMNEDEGKSEMSQYADTVGSVKSIPESEFDAGIAKSEPTVGESKVDDAVDKEEIQNILNEAFEEAIQQIESNEKDKQQKIDEADETVEVEQTDSKAIEEDEAEPIESKAIEEDEAEPIESKAIEDVEEMGDAEESGSESVKDLSVVSETIDEIDGEVSSVELVEKEVKWKGVVLQVRQKFDGEDCLVFVWDPRGVYEMETEPGKTVYGQGAPTVTCFRGLKKLAKFFRKNAENFGMGSNRFTITGMDVQRAKLSSRYIHGRHRKHTDGASSDMEPAAYVFPGNGRMILKDNLDKSVSPSELLQLSSCWCCVVLVLLRILHTAVYNSAALRAAVAVAGELFTASVNSQKPRFHRHRDFLTPTQVVNVFILGQKFVQFRLEPVVLHRDDNMEVFKENLRMSLEMITAGGSPYGLLWSPTTGCVAVWKASSCSVDNPRICHMATLHPNIAVMEYANAEDMATGYFELLKEAGAISGPIVFYKMFISVKSSEAATQYKEEKKQV